MQPNNKHTNLQTPSKTSTNYKNKFFQNSIFWNAGKGRKSPALFKLIKSIFCWLMAHLPPSRWRTFCSKCKLRFLSKRCQNWIWKKRSQCQLGLLIVSCGNFAQCRTAAQFVFKWASKTKRAKSRFKILKHASIVVSLLFRVAYLDSIFKHWGNQCHLCRDISRFMLF